MSFDPWIYFLKIQKSIRTPTPKVGAHLGVCVFIPSHFPTLLGAWNVIPGLHFQLTPLQALALVASPKLGSWHILFVCALEKNKIHSTFINPTLIIFLSKPQSLSLTSNSNCMSWILTFITLLEHYCWCISHPHHLVLR